MEPISSRMKCALTVQIGTFERWCMLEESVTTFMENNPSADLYIATDKDHTDYFLRLFPSACVVSTPNLGTDLGKFLFTLKSIYFLNKEYDLIIKVHTKKPCRWTFDLLRMLDLYTFQKILREFQNPSTGTVGMGPHIQFLGEKTFDFNRELLEEITKIYKQKLPPATKVETGLDLDFYSSHSHLSKVNHLLSHYQAGGCVEFPSLESVNKTKGPKFVTGSMFVTRFDILKKYLPLESIEYFLDKMKSQGETGYFTDLIEPKYTHTLERLICLFSHFDGKLVKGVW